MAYDSNTKKFYSYFREKIDAKYHGTGDLFASTCFGMLVNGKSLEESLKVAVDFVVESIKSTVNEKNSNWYGVNFEKNISMLVNCLR